jgi:hypothetical protein
VGADKLDALIATLHNLEALHPGVSATESHIHQR